MQIIIGKTAGFCFGVSNAIKKVEEELKNKNNIYCLGELVHNKQVNDDMEKKGLIHIDKLENAKKNMVIRSHGATKNTYEKANQLKLNLIDVTCPKVLKIHKIVEKYAKDNWYIFLINQKEHAETIRNN